MLTISLERILFGGLSSRLSINYYKLPKTGRMLHFYLNYSTATDNKPWGLSLGASNILNNIK